MECTHSLINVCHYSYITSFKPNREEECEDHYEKICNIVFVPQVFFNPIPAGGVVNFTPPCSFLHNSKRIAGLRLFKFSDFSYIPKALPLGLKPGLNTICLSPQAHCLNDYFFLNLCFDLLYVRF